MMLFQKNLLLLLRCSIGFYHNFSLNSIMLLNFMNIYLFLLFPPYVFYLFFHSCENYYVLKFKYERRIFNKIVYVF